MTIGDLVLNKQTEAISAVCVITDVRTLIASHLGVSVSRVTDEAHFTKDLGADWLDRLDLMMAVEDQFAGVEITDADVDRIELVGDLIRQHRVRQHFRPTETGLRGWACEIRTAEFVRELSF